MSVSCSALKTGRLFRGVAVLVSVLFITGQVFNCCLTNESFARRAKALFGLAGTKALEADAGEDAHPHCHGHAAGTEAAAFTDPGSLSPLDARFAQEGSCLSERAFSSKPMVASEFAQAPLPPAVIGLIPQPEFPRAFFSGRPRPQDKSSPPLYLTTLRLLV